MIDLANKGADIAKIACALASIPFKWKDKTGTYDMLLTLKGIPKDVKAIHSAYETLTRILPPVFPELSSCQSINRSMEQMRDDLLKYKAKFDRYLEYRTIEPHIDRLFDSLGIRGDNVTHHIKFVVLKKTYSLEGLLEMIRKGIKPAKRSSHNLWVEAIFQIVIELMRVVGTEQSACTYTADLLIAFYPECCKGRDAANVKMIYRTYRRKYSS